MDTVKVRLQTSQAFRGTWHCLSSTVQKEGAFALFRGVMPPVVANAPINATVFAVHGAAIRHLQKRKSENGGGGLDHLDHFAAGSIAGAAQSVFACPNELIKIKQQGQANAKLSAVDLFSKNIARGTLFQGWWSTLARDTPAFGIYFAMYEACKNWMFKNHNPDVAAFGAGAVAGMGKW
jgi:solute carrier family 25 carnitine/acylcarnitine transporter 20/29